MKIPGLFSNKMLLTFKNELIIYNNRTTIKGSHVKGML